MQQTTKKKDPFINSSIIISDNAITYCNYTNYSFNSIDTVSLIEEKDLSELILKNPIYENTKLIVANSPGLFVPQALFNEKNLKTYYENFDYLKETDVLKIDITKNHLNSVVYKTSSNIEKIKNTYFSDLNQFNYLTILYDFLLTKIKNNDEKRLFVNIQKDSFDIFLFYGKNLQLANRYPNKGPDSFFYFLYFIIEKNELIQNDFSINFLGKYSFFTKYYQGVQIYHNKIDYILPENNLKKNIPPTPFLIDLHANYFRNS